MPLTTWRPLRPADGPAVLCVDFTQAQARADAGFADLAALLPGRYAVWGTDEGAWRDDADPPPGQPAPWLRESESTGDDTGAVFGYCAGGALACALAHHLARRRGAPPPVVLFDPTTVTPWTLHDQFDTALGSLATVAPEPDLRAARDGAREDVLATADDRHGAADLARLASLLVARYEALARPVCQSRGVPTAIADQLCARVAAYLRYLVLSAAAPLDLPGTGLVVLSAAHGAPPVRGGDQRTLRLDVARSDLLADPTAAAAATDVLDGAARRA